MAVPHGIVASPVKAFGLQPLFPLCGEASYALTQESLSHADNLSRASARQPARGARLPCAGARARASQQPNMVSSALLATVPIALRSFR